MCALRSFDLFCRWAVPLPNRENRIPASFCCSKVKDRKINKTHIDDIYVCIYLYIFVWVCTYVCIDYLVLSLDILYSLKGCRGIYFDILVARLVYRYRGV